MATTIFNFKPQDAEYPATKPAIDDVFEDTNAGAGSAPDNPNSLVPCIAFAIGSPTNSYVEFSGVMPQGYTATTTINVILIWRSTNASNNVRWGAQMKAVSDAEAITRAWATTVEGNFAAPGTIGNLEYSTIALTNAGSSLDGAAAGDYVRFRIYRESEDTANDTHAATAYLVGVRVEY